MNSQLHLRPIGRRFVAGFVSLLSLSAVVSAFGQNTVYVRDQDNRPSIYVSPADATFTAAKNYDNGVTVSIYGSSSGGSYISHHLDFAAPREQPLTVGVYENATRFPFQEPNEPGLSVSGNGSGCNELTGRFEIKQLVYGPEDSITSFHATFVQYCEGMAPPSTGEILFNARADVPPRNHITSALAVFGTKGQPFKYQIRASNNPTSFTASGLPPGLGLDASSGLLSGTPTAEGVFAIAITATGASGHANGTLSLTIDPPTRSRGAFSALFMNSAAGDYIGQGEVRMLREADGYFTASRYSYTNGIFVSYETASTSTYENWRVQFAPAQGQPLEVGVYKGAGRSLSSTAPMIDISGSGRGCNETKGEFEIKEIATKGDQVVAFRASFIQYCGSASTSPLKGEVWFRAPVAITSEPYLTGTKGSPFAHQIVANNEPTSFTASGLPPGLSLNQSTGIISGTPSISGTFSVLLRAIGNAAPADGRLTLVIAPATGSSPPVITSPDAATVMRGQAFTYQITATNSPISYGASGLPPGLSVDTSTGVISGTPTTAGIYDVILTASNVAATGGASLTLTVNPPPPVITSSSSATAVQGQPFSFQVTATNSPTSYNATGLPNGLTINSSGLISGTPTQSGSFSVALIVRNGGGSGSQNFMIKVDPPPPEVNSPDTAATVKGQQFSYQITATGNPTSFGATGLPAGLSLNSSTGVISGIPTTTGTLQVAISATNSYGTGTRILSLTINSAPPPPPPAQLANISTRLHVGTGENVLIGGFIISGDSPKRVIVRALAPSLQVDGTPVPGTLADPVLELFDADGNSVVRNDNWRDTQEDEIEASTIPPSDNREAAIVRSLPPGNHTAIISGKNGATGIALVEVYDLDTAAASKVVNVSSRGFVQAGDSLIGGVIVTGTGSHRTIIRALGPSLSGAGIAQPMQDPTLELFDNNGNSVAVNDNWKDSQQFDIDAAGFAPADEHESAIIAGLQAGNHTAVVRGKGGTTGVAVVEVYSAP